MGIGFMQSFFYHGRCTMSVMRGGPIGLLLVCITAFSLHAESGYDAWLRYPRLPHRVSQTDVQVLGDSVTLLGRSEVLLAARDEFSRGIQGMVGRNLRQDSSVPTGGGVVIGRVGEVAKAIRADGFDANISGDGFQIKTVRQGSAR